ncbi:SpoIIE family protein phosphatase [Leptospira sp. 96542]|nr:SpoIIE family protein phosphatase [Leptospira sp. 96542]
MKSIESSPLTLEYKTNSRDIGQYFEYTIADKKTNIEDIISKDVNWIPNKNKTISFPGVTDSLWLRINLFHKSDLPHSYFLHFSSPVVDYFELYYLSHNQWERMSSGEQVLQSEKPIYSHLPAFPLIFSPNEERTIYVKITSANPIFNFVSIYNSSSFIAFAKKQDIFFAAYFGAGFMMFFFSLFLAHTLRYRQFFFYFFYLATILLINAFSTGFIQYIEIGNNHHWKNYLFPIAIYLTSAFGLLFTLEFLNVETYFKKLASITKFFIILFFLMIFMVFFVELRFFIQIGVLFVLIPITLGLTISILVTIKAKKKIEPLLFLMAFGSVLVGGSINTLTVQGLIIPFRISAYSLPLGSAIEVFFLSLALVFKVSDYRKATEDKQELDLQLKIAQKLQNGLLPKNTGIVNGFKIGFRYIPTSEIGGEFVQILENPNGLGFFLCDVSGHGVPAAMIASMTKVSLQIWNDQLNNPATAAEKIRQSLLSSLSGHFLSAFFVYIGIEKRIMRIANAGHHPMIFLDKLGNLQTISSYGRAINEYIPSEIIEREIPLLLDGTFILYTDGVTEARNQNTGELFGEERLYSTLKNAAHLSPQLICDNVILEVQKFQNSKRADDDITILAFST